MRFVDNCRHVNQPLAENFLGTGSPYKSIEVPMGTFHEVKTSVCRWIPWQNTKLILMAAG
jgi:hypothetical protein